MEMKQTEDSLLLNRLANDQTGEAMRALMDRYVPLVYGVCRRRTGQNELAEDATQAVFVLLYRKKASLIRHSSLAGWLYTCADSVSRDAVRREARRMKYEEMSVKTSLQNGARTDDLGPDLDIAMRKLASKDCEALVLRFIEGYTLFEVGQALKISEDAARMRVQRSLGRLRQELSKLGIASSPSVLSDALATTRQPVPAPLLSALHRADFSQVIPSNVQLLTKGAFPLMTPTLGITALSAIALFVVAGSASIGFAHHGPSGPRGLSSPNTAITEKNPEPPPAATEGRAEVASMIQAFVGKWSMKVKMTGFDQKDFSDRSQPVTVAFDPIKSVIHIRGNDSAAFASNPNADWPADLERGTLLIGSSDDPKVDTTLHFRISHVKKTTSVLLFSGQSPHSSSKLTVTHSKNQFSYALETSVWHDGMWLKGKFTWLFERPTP